MNPPKVYELIMPTNQRINRMIAKVRSMCFLSFSDVFINSLGNLNAWPSNDQWGFARGTEKRTRPKRVLVNWDKLGPKRQFETRPGKEADQSSFRPKCISSPERFPSRG